MSAPRPLSHSLPLDQAYVCPREAVAAEDVLVKSRVKKIRGLMKMAVALLILALCTQWLLPLDDGFGLTMGVTAVSLWLLFTGALDWMDGRHLCQELRVHVSRKAATHARLRKAAGLAPLPAPSRRGSM